MGETRSGKKADFLRCLECNCPADTVNTESLLNETISITDEYEQEFPSIHTTCITNNSPDTALVETPDTALAGQSRIYAKILDGALVVQQPSPRTARTLQEFSDTVFMPYILSQHEVCQDYMLYGMSIFRIV